MAAYVTPDELRDEGVAADKSDSALLRIIQRSSALIDAWTHRWFEPRQMTLLLDGPSHSILQIGPPIIGITQIRVLSRDSSLLIPTPDELVDLDGVRVFNRHMMGLTDPDDRANPKLQFLSSWLDDAPRRMVEIFQSGWWPRGVQNIEVTGYFGYTDPDPDEVVALGDFPLGKTPEMIKYACIMLAVRDLLPLADVEGRTEAALASRVQSLRTRDQSISYSSSNSSTGGSSVATTSGSGVTGNPEVMAVLAPYCRGPALGAV